jgi:hypothetical protein
MMHPSNTLSDRNLEASTMLLLKREPACFAFLCDRAVSAPLPIDAINLDLASLDYFGGHASLWAALEVRSGSNGQPTAVLGFDEHFLRPFTRALIAAAASHDLVRMTILREPDGTPGHRVVEYVTAAGAVLRELVITRHDAVLDIAGRATAEGDEETLFQLPANDAFLRAFVEMSYKADQALRDTLLENEKLARRRRASLAHQASQ